MTWPRRLLLVGLCVLGAAGLAASCFVLLDLVQLVLTGTVTDRHGRTDWDGVGLRMASAVAGTALLRLATHWHRRAWSRCPSCGGVHDLPVRRVARPPVSAASRRTCLAAAAGCLAFGPYLAVHGLHAAGLAPWLDDLYNDKPILPGPALLVFAVLAVGLVGPAVFLMLGLVRPWGMKFPAWTGPLAGRRVPRYLPLTAVALVAPTLSLYGVGSLVYALVHGYRLLSLGGAGSLAFGGYGWALLVAASSYLRRTRPVCVTDRSEPQPDMGHGRC
ncbi:hypothetical protein HDA39_003919 [Kribbella italica]|uniref:Uncharacterized protein n=1 Tax=Kribbella italica TaxID=1540520 RepID=A0A7W9J883_9ACTN|nr:hypothetical protein [Kribbella italica]